MRKVTQFIVISVKEGRGTPQAYQLHEKSYFLKQKTQIGHNFKI